MRIIKRLDIFILKAYLLLFTGTFGVCLFIFMMQFTWRYLDDLIGKGLSIQVLAQFFWYAGLTLVPMALPLGILLASLITFGNMGEKLELLSMKAAGIPLLRILAPIFIFVIMLSGASFYFQNKVGPEATKQLASLVWSMKQKSPELEIPEAKFYAEIPGFNIYVGRKDIERGILHDIMIYDTKGGYNDLQIVLADSGRLQTTADKQHLKLTLYGGERFRNMDAHSGNMIRATVPYMRETFTEEVDLITFDGDFSIMDANLFAANAATKDIPNITQGIDSLTQRIDSTGRSIYDIQLYAAMARTPGFTAQDSAQANSLLTETKVPYDTLVARLDKNQTIEALRIAQSKASQLKAEYEFRALISKDECRQLRLHYIEWHKKFTLSVACLVFFFIGAPLGAIIRKGGLGISVVISVLIFIFYYIVNASGEKMAKIGEWYVTFGVWLSSMVLAPIAVFLTIKANNDSVVFNIDGYRFFFRRLLGLRETRKLNRKEVVIEEPDYADIQKRLLALCDECKQYAEQQKLWRFPSYIRLFFRNSKDQVMTHLNDELEDIVSKLHNCKNNTIISILNQIPILIPDAHTRPFGNPRLNVAVGIIFPIGIFFYLRIWRFRIRLHRDLQNIQRMATLIYERIAPYTMVADTKAYEN